MPTPQTPKTEMITFRGTPSLKNLLDRVSKQENVNRSDLIRITLERALPDEVDRRGPHV